MSLLYRPLFFLLGSIGGVWTFCNTVAAVEAEGTSAADVLLEETSQAVGVNGYEGAAEPRTAAAIFGQDIRETQWLTPEQAAASFHLPPGFVVELVASEPEIDKPMNMAFDHRGRLWVTCTLEYPHPVKPDAVGRDSIKILEDSNADGNFDKVTTFADGLNIPIGLLPYGDGAICFSIPNLWYLQDTNGDGHADQKSVLLGPFDTTRDTHGMVNSLRMGLDGWVYACHGFSNRSDVTAADGSRVQMTSGNTFRFRPDGSRIELYTMGQVNPFGMTRDEWGNWYTADCHSKPLTALLAGASYPSFGRPHDGLGFAPSMMDHLHGSTAIAGVEYYQADQFPEPYRRLFYSGNVMTCRINCNRPVRNGMTVIAEEMPDFMTSDDPWFRPVDICLGPDGCLYIADFYNKIIGHYEVPLDHPERDRSSGRIWRVRYVGDKSELAADSASGVASDDRQQESLIWLESLGSPNLQIRRQAIETALRSGLKYAELSSIEDWTAVALDSSHPLLLRQSAIEVLARIQALSTETLQSLLAEKLPEISSLILRIVDVTSDPAEVKPVLLEHAESLLLGAEPEVLRAAIETLGRWGEPSVLPKLANLAVQSQTSDPVQEMAARIAMRNILQRHPKVLERLVYRWENDSNWSGSAESRWIAGVLPGVHLSDAAEALLRYVTALGDQADPDLTSAAIDHAARFPQDSTLKLTLTTIDRFAGENTAERVKRLVQVAQAFPLINKSHQQPMQRMAERTKAEVIEHLQESLATEGPSSVWMDEAGSAWDHQTWTDTDDKQRRLLSSLTRGEQYTGVLTSEPFACPPKLSFWICGHNGFPDEEDHRRNRVRLVVVETGQVLMESFPPRSDVAHQVIWELSQYEGINVKIQAIDGDSANAYAWIAVGDFSESFLQMGGTGHWLDLLSEMSRKGLTTERLENDLAAFPLSPRQRALLMTAQYQGTGQHLIATLARQALSVGRPDLVLSLSADSSESENGGVAAVAQELARSMTGATQSVLARALLRSTEGCELLADMLEQGWLNPSSLRGAATLLPESLSPARKELLEQYFVESEKAGLDTSYVATRLQDIDWSAASSSRGQQLFKQHCANCHQLRGQGVVVGPQLDGAVQRGMERLAEDILLPNLNVDREFRVSTLLLDDGSIVSGQIQEENEEIVRLIGSDGKPFTVDAADVVQRRESEQSLMPANMGDLLDKQQLSDLLIFLVESSAGSHSQ